MALKIGGLYKFVGVNWNVYLNKNHDITSLGRNDLFVVISFDEVNNCFEILMPKNGKLGVVYCHLGVKYMSWVVLLSEGKEK